TASNQFLYLGFNATGVGTYSMTNVAATLNVFGGVMVGGTTGSPQGTGVFNLSAGSANVTGQFKVWNTTNTAVNLSGGTLAVGSLDTSGNPARFLGNGVSTGWSAGTLDLTNSNLSLDASGPLGTSLTLSPSMTLRISGAARTFTAPASSTFSSTGTL